MNFVLNEHPHFRVLENSQSIMKHLYGCDTVLAARLTKYQKLIFQDWKEVNWFAKWNNGDIMSHLVYFQLVYILQSRCWICRNLPVLLYPGSRLHFWAEPVPAWLINVESEKHWLSKREQASDVERCMFQTTDQMTAQE